MIPSTSQRLPRKTCGLFDTGFAGDAADVTSLGLGVSADLDQALFTFESPAPSTSHVLSDESRKQPPVAPLSDDILVKQDLDDWNFDLLDPLGDLEDPLADGSLDTFVDLEPFLMENSFLGDQSHIEHDKPAEVEPVICFDAAEFGGFNLSGTLVKSETAFEHKDITVEDNNLFKVPASVPIVALDPNVDHDYTSKAHEMPTSSCKNVNKRKISSKNKCTTKRKRLSSTASDESEVSSSTSMIDQGEFDEIVDKQSLRRIKNNIASKRSREQRKQKIVDMDSEAEQLIVANEALRKKIIELENLAKEMKELLVAKMAGKA